MAQDHPGAGDRGAPADRRGHVGHNGGGPGRRYCRRHCQTRSPGGGGGGRLRLWLLRHGSRDYLPVRHPGIAQHLDHGRPSSQLGAWALDSSLKRSEHRSAPAELRYTHISGHDVRILIGQLVCQQRTALAANRWLLGIRPWLAPCKEFGKIVWRGAGTSCRW